MSAKCADDRSGILLTGGAGVVGRILLRRLAEEFPERPVYALVHNRKPEIAHSNTRLISGDITEPMLGMTTEQHRRVCDSVDTIVHCAASTRFTLPLDESRRVNVAGTANVLQFARRTPRLRMLLHISSTFIAGRRHGELREIPLHDPAGWFNPYEQSKFEAEQVILQQGKNLPWIIARLSTLAGNSQTGHVAEFNYFHQVLRLIPRNPLPLIPGRPDTPVDVVPDDWTGDALLSILRTCPPAGAVLHLCAGPAQSLPAQEVLELGFGLHWRAHPASRAIMPRFVNLSEFQAFIAGLRRHGSETLLRFAELLLLYMPHLEVHQHFLNTNTSTLLAASGITPPRPREFLPLVMLSCM